MPAPKREPSVYLTDAATKSDALGFSDFQPALVKILTTAQTPLTVGIFGPWGSGKTSLLQMIQEELDEKFGDRVETVWFTAWKYDRHEALCVLDAAGCVFQCEHRSGG